MPELPEVEVNRRGLKRLVGHKQIQEIEIYWPRIIVNSDLSAFRAALIGQKIQDVRRRGKFIIFVLTEGYLISHLRMEGKYFYYLPEEVPETKNKHTHVVIEFTDGSQLHYHDVRKFGRMEYIESSQYDTYFDERKLGPEPTITDFELTQFEKDLSKVRQMIKPALLSQRWVAGLGNIYVDEVLFKSRIHPMRRACDLTKSEVMNLHQAVITTMSDAIKAGGSTIRTYKNIIDEAGNYQDQHQVYGRQGKKCYRCAQPIEKIKVSQRGTHYCPHCQPFK